MNSDIPENISTTEYVVFFTVTALLFVSVYLVGRFVLPKITKARRIAPREDK